MRESCWQCQLLLKGKKVPYVLKSPNTKGDVFLSGKLESDRKCNAILNTLGSPLSARSVGVYVSIQCSLDLLKHLRWTSMCGISDHGNMPPFAYPSR